MRLRSLLLIATLAVSSVPISNTVFADEDSEGDEKVVKLEDIPAPARKTILKEAKGAPILKVEEEKEKGKTLYEATIKQGKDEIGIVVDEPAPIWWTSRKGLLSSEFHQCSSGKFIQNRSRGTRSVA